MPGEYTPAPTVMPIWYDIAMAEMQADVREFPGKASNPRIEEYHRSVGLGTSDDDIAWCSSFLNWVMQEAGIPGSGSPAARSWLGWGIPSRMEPGAICVFWRESPTSWKGHVGIIHEVDHGNQTVWVLGGNERDAIRIVEYPFHKVLGCRAQKKVRHSTTIRAATVTGSAGTALGTLQVVNAMTDTAEKTAEAAKKTGIIGSQGFTIALTVVLTALVVGGVLWVCRERLKRLNNDGR